ncbi:MAG: choice-of-anchor J domain-containing protein [Bacteroidales bacterium]|nr:choice-of-anchor J domain-containing protein [Bacteroidales bacterium]
MKRLVLTLVAVAISFAVMAQKMPMRSSSPFVAAKSVKNAAKDVTPEWHQISQDVTGTNFLDPSQTISTAAIRNAGKAMVIDFSATWCSWCWVMHTNGILEGIADEFGDDIEVIWVEADASTSAASITGQGSSSDQGNWTQTAGGQTVPYPIIDDPAFANIIGGASTISGFPTVVFISPSGYWCDVYGTDWGFGPYSATDAVAAIQVLMNNYPQAGVAPQGVSISGMNTAFVGQEYGFEVNYVSVDPVTSINWTFQNGDPATATGSSASTTWNTAGTVTVTVEVTNTVGTTTATKTITVRDGWTFGDEMDYTGGTDYVTSIGYGSGGTGEIAWGIKYPAAVVAGHNYLTSVSAYINDGSTGTYDVRIYEGTTPTTLLYEAPYEVTTTDEWHTFNIMGGIAIDQTKDLWVTLHCNGVSYPASMTEFCGDPNSQFIEYQGQWVPITDLADFPNSWMIKAMTSANRPAFNFEVAGPTDFMSGDTKDFTITGPADATYNWTLQGATPATATGTMVSASWAAPGNYTITVQGTLGGNNLTKTLSVTVRDGNITLPFTDSFENGLAYWTAVDADGDGYTWMNGGFPGHTGETAIGSASFINNVGVLTPDNWLISKQFTSPAGGVTIEWWEYGVDANDYADNYSVYVSPNGGDQPANFTQQIFNGCPQAPKTWVKHSRNIAATGTIRVAFRHHDVTNMYWLLIDDVKITAGNTSGIDNMNSANVDFYPNPVNDKLYISEEVAKVNVIDINGRTVISSENTRVVDMSNLSNGVYFVRVITDNGTAVKKVVKK